LDLLILSHADIKSLGNVEQTDFMPFDPTVKRTEGTIRDLVTGQDYKTTKGAPHVIMMLSNNEVVNKKCEADVTSFGLRGVRCLAVAKTDQEGKWHLLGLLTFLDPPRHDTKVPAAPPTYLAAFLPACLPD
jgi:H+-transporting ATPase